MKRVLFLIVILIVYGSLFPFNFTDRALPGGPFAYLLGRWDTITNSYLIHDVAVNIALYVPLGLVANFALAGMALPIPVLLAFGLSLMMELAQIYEPGRQATMVDVLANTSGATLGVVVAVLLRSISISLRPPLRIPEAFGWIFLASTAAIRLAPFSFTPLPAHWSWVPFGYLLQGNQEIGLLALAAKSGGYAVAIGLFRRTGRPLGSATAVVVTLIALAEIGRIFEPNSNPGITDPLIAALVGFALTGLPAE